MDVVWWPVVHALLKLFGTTRQAGAAVCSLAGMEPWPLTHFVLELLGVAASVMGFVLPRYTTIADMVLEGSVGGRSSIPCAATMYNCVLWALYGSVSPDGSELVVLTNIFGACCMFYCLLKFLRYSEDVEQFGQILICPAVATPLVIVLTAFYFSDMGANLLFLGWVCALSRGLVGVLPLVMNLRTVYLQGAALNTGSLLLSSTGLLTSAVWTAFACTGTQSNGFIFWPSLVALVSAGLQVVLHIVLMLAH